MLTSTPFNLCIICSLSVITVVKEVRSKMAKLLILILLLHLASCTAKVVPFYCKTETAICKCLYLDQDSIIADCSYQEMFHPPTFPGALGRMVAIVNMTMTPYCIATQEKLILLPNGLRIVCQREYTVVVIINIISRITNPVNLY